jgi:hydrogenase nickel incorporation protein HypB
MCATCGCGNHSGPHAHPHRSDAHSDGHSHEHPHDHGAPGAMHAIERRILDRNDEVARANRRRLSMHQVFALNVVSAPGAGKTTLLERTIRDIGGELAIEVIEGDQETDNDARRLRDTGCRVVQLNTGTGCHLDAEMVERGLELLTPMTAPVLMIENVGNLVCPALFDLGEHARVLVSSVTEGDDKPVKYPHIFRSSTIVLLNKIDLLPYVQFDVGRFQMAAHDVNPNLAIISVSATRGDCLEEWYGWLRQQSRRLAA